MSERVCPWCGGRDLRLLKTFAAPPPGEKPMGIAPGAYRRVLSRCGCCGHISNDHAHGEALSAAYRDGYRAEAYGVSLQKTYDKIRALPEGKSDNSARVAALRGWLREAGLPDTGGRLLDVGSGSCVFGGAMRDAGWNVTVVDVDPISTLHAREHVGVTALTGELLEIDLAAQTGDTRWDLVSFNKVLEHVEPATAVAMLAKLAHNLTPRGAIYVELPDADGAFAAGGTDRQEFFLEHWGAFTAGSTAFLARRAGFSIVTLSSVHEPSGKYTIRALLRPLNEVLSQCVA
jgi:2-polyprenyl-3-methyl-5-hydroxy-6-metoxy-1,4-benzoquinol methylase